MLYSSLIRPLLFQFDPEKVHHFSLAALQQPFFSTCLKPWTKPVITHRPVKLWGLTFRNPIGLAAGFDKNALAVPAWENLGFGFAELGTVTQHPQPGNPRPRLFRLPREKAVINRLGFPNDGADVIAQRLQQLKASDHWPSIPMGINLGKSKITSLEEAPGDYLYSFRRLREFGDYFVVNVSSPNTPGLRDLQQKSFLNSILFPLVRENSVGIAKPLLVKIAPDLTFPQIDEVLECIQDHQLAGIIATNTTLNKEAVHLKEEGGLSGLPLRKRSTAVIRYIAEKTLGKLPIIGVGGIFTADDAQEKLSAGATLLQLYTGFIYQGPMTVSKICRKLR